LADLRWMTSMQGNGGKSRDARESRVRAPDESRCHICRGLSHGTLTGLWIIISLRLVFLYADLVGWNSTGGITFTRP
jgi:hypothetical protein